LLGDLLVHSFDGFDPFHIQHMQPREKGPAVDSTVIDVTDSKARGIISTGHSNITQVWTFLVCLWFPPKDGPKPIRVPEGESGLKSRYIASFSLSGFPTNLRTRTLCGFSSVKTKLLSVGSALKQLSSFPLFVFHLSNSQAIGGNPLKTVFFVSLIKVRVLA
jgi:hypothetical protein